MEIYGTDDPRNYEQVLLTHHRRDVVEQARIAIDAGAAAIAPGTERASFSETMDRDERDLEMLQ